MRSKKYCILTAVILLLTSTSAFASEIEYTALYVGSSKAFVNDIQKQIDADNPDVAVFVENDRSYVPVRFISESYDGQVEWTEKTQDGKYKICGQGNITYNRKT